MSLLYVIVLAIIVVVLLSVALYRSSQVKTKADYLVAGRSLPAVVLVLTLLTSWIGAGSLFAGAENAYKNGFAALWQPAGGWLGLLLIYFIAPRAPKFATTRRRECWERLPFSSPTSASPAINSRAAATYCT
jgi:Na+/proline symporter